MAFKAVEKPAERRFVCPVCVCCPAVSGQQCLLFVWRTVFSQTPCILYWVKGHILQNCWALKEPSVSFSLSTVLCVSSCHRSWRFQWRHEIWNGSIIPSWSAGKRTEESWTSSPPLGCTGPDSSCWPSLRGAKTCSRIQPSWWRHPSPPCWRRARKRRKARREAWRNPNPSRRFQTPTLFPPIIPPGPQNRLTPPRKAARPPRLCQTLNRTNSKRLFQTPPLPKNHLCSSPHKALAAQSRIRTCKECVWACVCVRVCVVRAPAPFSQLCHFFSWLGRITLIPVLNCFVFILHHFAYDIV